MNAIAELKQRIVNAEQRAEIAESKLLSFFTGDVPDKATFEHMILAQYGRIRLSKMAKQAYLLGGKTSI